jgi:hypothetical protein
MDVICSSEPHCVTRHNICALCNHLHEESKCIFCHLISFGGGGGGIAFKSEGEVVLVLNKLSITLMKMYWELKYSFTHS